jgi:DNA polymerase-3 subunit alpha
MPLGHVDKLAKLVPQNPAKPITLAEALATEQKLREEVEKDEKVARLFKIAGALEGLYSNASTHAAGIVIGDRPLHEVTPLYRDSKSDMPATQFNMKWVEPAGLIKFDFLGLKTLTVLAMASNLVRRRSGEFKLENIALDDPETYAMLGRGETIGVFQLESAGMRKALVEMHADRFEDIIALVALYRPGPMANIPTYCAVKLGDEEPDYIHPAIEPILKETFGVIIYQEQVMQIAQVLSGYSLGEADNLRRAMGKKIKSEMSAQRDRFVTGAVERGLTKNKSNEIFDLLAKFADYGFNKSHDAAYALIAYQTAWFKAHYPAEFLAASMTFDKNQTDKLAEFRDEALRIGITVDPPSICHSGVDFDVAIDEDDKLTIRYALSAIKGVGEGQADSLVRSRGTLPYKDLADFANRINPREVNKKVLDNLAACGAFDELLENRACVFASIETILAAANRHTDDRKAGQNALFGKDEAETLALAKVPPWPIAETLKREYEAAGFFLSGHPLDAYESLMSKLRVSRWGKFTADVKKGATAGRLAAVVLDRAERRTKSGSKMGIVQLSDVSGQYEAILFQEGLNQFRDKLEKGAAVLLTLSASIDGDDVRARIISVESLEIAAARAQKGIRIILNNAAPILDIKNKLTKKGEREVSILFKREKSPEEIEIRLPGGYSVNPETAHALRAVPGVLEVEYL